jgi:RNA recognition motif-containing protein
VKIPQARGCGFVSFVHRHSAEQAIAQLNGCMIGSNRVRLSWGRNNTTAPLSPVSPMQVLQHSLSSMSVGNAASSPMFPPPPHQQQQQMVSQQPQQSVPQSPIGWSGVSAGKLSGFSHGMPSPDASPITAAMGHHSSFLHQPQPLQNPHHQSQQQQQQSSHSLKMDHPSSPAVSAARLSAAASIRPPMSAPPLENSFDYGWRSPFSGSASASPATVSRPLSLIGSGSSSSSINQGGASAVQEDEVDAMLPSFLRDFTVSAAAAAAMNKQSAANVAASPSSISPSPLQQQQLSLMRPNGVMSMPTSPTLNSGSKSPSYRDNNSALGALWM